MLTKSDVDRARLKDAKYVWFTVPPMKTTLGGDMSAALSK